MTVTLPVAELVAVAIVAVIVAVCPDDTPVTTPAALTVATLVLLLVHVTRFVRSCVLLSANVPVAVNWTVWVAVTVGFVGAMVSELFSACVPTTTVEVPVTPPCAADTVVVPAAAAVTSPALTVATLLAPLVHVAELVTSLDVPSTVTALAENWSVSPVLRYTAAGVRVM